MKENDLWKLSFSNNYYIIFFVIYRDKMTRIASKPKENRTSQKCFQIHSINIEI